MVIVGILCSSKIITHLSYFSRDIDAEAVKIQRLMSRGEQSVRHVARVDQHHTEAVPVSQIG